MKNEPKSQLFQKMGKKFNQSLKKDFLIKRKILKNNKYIKNKIFDFHVKIKKNSYLNMIKQKYISVLLNFNKEELDKGVNEIYLKYPKNIEIYRLT